MLYKYYNLICKHLKKRSEYVKKQEGFTIVEVMVALLVISIITVGLVQGIRVSVNTLRLNKEKTKAAAIANEKIELIRTLSYDDIELHSEDPDWPDADIYPMLFEDGYDIDYNITEVVDEDTDGSYKQIAVSVSKSPMKTPVSVITQLYPLGQEEEPPSGDTIPPAAPTGLIATAASSTRIDLDWNDNTETDLAGYRVYRSTTIGFIPGSDSFVEEVTISSYSDTGLTAETTYYYRVTAIDTSDNESQQSEQASATTLKEYTEISLPFTYDGAGEYYWKTNEFSTNPNDWSHYVNSWNIDLLDINGVDYKNKWVVQHSIPPAADGYWYIHYIGGLSNSHVEFK